MTRPIIKPGERIKVPKSVAEAWGFTDPLVYEVIPDPVPTEGELLIDEIRALRREMAAIREAMTRPARLLHHWDDDGLPTAAQ